MSRLALTLALTLAIGIGLGYLLTRRQLHQCRQENELLLDDLTRAVGRGVMIEAQLNLCKEAK